MPAIVYPLATAALNLTGFLWQNRDTIGPAFKAIGNRVESALLSATPQIQRVGTSLVSLQDGQAQVIALLHQQSARTEAMASAVTGLTNGQAALAHSLNALQNLSMISLGVSVVSHLVLQSQFKYLREHLASIDRRVRWIQDLIEAQQLAGLQAGLAQLQSGIEDIEIGQYERGRATINHNAANNLAISVNAHAALLEGQLSGPRPERRVIRELFRHLVVGVLGEAGCHLALENPSQAQNIILERLKVIERYGQVVFAQTVANEPMRFLCPAMGEHHITIEFMAELFRQASHAGAITGKSTIGATELFEEWRTQLHRVRDPFRRSALVAMRVVLAEAVSAIEEVNRVKSFAASIAFLTANATSFAEVMGHLQQEITIARETAAESAEDTCYAYFLASQSVRSTGGF